MRAIVVFALVPVAIVVGVGVALGSAILAHEVLVILVGQDGIPAFDDTIGMRIVVAADYAVGVLAGVLVLVAGWRWAGSRRTPR